MADMLLASLTTFMCVSVSAFVALQMLYTVNKKKQIQIETQLESDDK